MKLYSCFKQVVLFCFFLILSMAKTVETKPQLITLFVHGIADSCKQCMPLRQAIDNVYSLDFACSRSSVIWPFNMLIYCSLGQGDELMHIDHELKILKERFPHAEFMLAGVSRGASAILNYLATHEHEMIKAVILESPFDMIENVLDYRAERWGIKEYLPAWMIQYIVPLIFSRFTYEDVQPGKVINNIIWDIPMLFVTVEGDHSVPAGSTINLIAQRRENNHKHMHHLHLNEGRHGKLLAGPDGERYKQVMHAFLAHYNLVHNKELAEKGKESFTTL